MGARQQMFEDLLDCEIVEQKVAPRYFPTICSHCFDLQAPVKRCSACKVMPYCGKECAKDAWKLHRHVCKPLGKMRENLIGPYEEGNGVGQWMNVRATALAALTKFCGRPLMEHEKETCLFPHSCDNCHICYPHAELFNCPDCRMVSYCSEECQEKGREHHTRFCDTHTMSAQFMALVNAQGSYFPPIFCEQRETTPLVPMAESFMSHLVSRRWGPIQGMPRDSMHIAFLFTADALSYPLSVAYALQKVGMGKDGCGRLQDMVELTLHMVGAKVDPELNALTKYEEILHMLPGMSRLNIVAVGPELYQANGEQNHDDLLCDGCRADGRRIRYFQYSGRYEKYAREHPDEWHSTPDAVVAFNCGFHEHPEGSREDTWKGALQRILRNTDVPLIFTSYTLSEAQSDVQKVQGYGATVAMEPRVNPYKSFIPIRDWARDNECDFFYNNQYISVVRGNATA